MILSDREIDEIKLLISELSAMADTANSMYFDMYVREFRPLAMNDGLFHPSKNNGRLYPSTEVLKSEFEASQRLDLAPAMNRLVELGPRALPLLLASLDDATPTRIEFTRRGFCHTILDCNIWVNPHNPFESNDAERLASSPTVEIDSYTVPVGDLCFLAIGQIVGREYHIFTDVPSATVKVCSPTRDARLCEQVRRTWSSSEPAQMLLDSLLSDFSLPPENETRTRYSSRLPYEAATRLLYYFPRESLSLIIDRLDHLDVTSPSSGYDAGEFVKAVSWSNEPELRASLLRILDRSSNPIAAVAASRAATPDQAVRVHKKLGRMIEERSADEADAKGECYPLLVALGRYGGPETQSTFENYLKRRTVQHCRIACLALREVRGEWASHLLGPLLEDQRRSGAGHDPRSQVLFNGESRICDEAAETIRCANSEFAFQPHAHPSVRDQQIKVMRDQIIRK